MICIIDLPEPLIDLIGQIGNSFVIVAVIHI